MQPHEPPSYVLCTDQIEREEAEKKKIRPDGLSDRAATTSCDHQIFR